MAEGLAQMALKNYKFALACFQKALEMDEDYPGGCQFCLVWFAF